MRPRFALTPQTSQDFLFTTEDAEMRRDSELMFPPWNFVSPVVKIASWNFAA